MVHRQQRTDATAALAEARAAAAAGRLARAAGILLNRVVHMPGKEPAVQVEAFLLLTQLCLDGGRLAEARGYAVLARILAEHARRPDLAAVAAAAFDQLVN